MRIDKGARTVGLLLALSGAACGKNASPAAPTPLTPTAPTATPTPGGNDEIIKVETNLVTMPVSVLDREGRFISGLQKNDFKIYEDGVEQKILNFAISIVQHIIQVRKNCLLPDIFGNAENLPKNFWHLYVE